MKTWKIPVLLSYISIASASATIITPALPKIETAFQIGDGMLEWVISIFLIGYMLGQIIYGPLANRIGRLPALRVGFAVNLVGIAICLAGSYSGIYSVLLAGRFITAIGASAGLVCTFILLNESLSPERAKHAISFAVVSFTLGIGAAVLLGGLITEYLNWEDCFWLLMMHGIIMLASTWIFDETLKETKNTALFHMLKEYGQALCHRQLFIFAMFVGLVSVFSYCFAAAAPVIAQHSLGLTSSEYGYFNLVNMLGMFIGAMLSGKALKNFNNIVVIIVAAFVMLLGIAFMFILDEMSMLNSFIFFGLSTLMYFASSFIFPAASHIASNAIADKANASGAMNLINMGSAVLTVSIMGYLPLSPLLGFVIITGGYAVLCLLALTMAKNT
ncbi:MFS transporter [Francisellaceae bacterium]|nr:MFS transporter [Francisellaceae bacterium]